MEGSMSLKKRAIEGIVVAGSLVMMSTIAQAADLDGVQVRNAAVQAETDFATVGTAGVVARLDQLEAEAFGDIEAATAGVNQTGRLLVATAEEAVSDTEAAETLDAQLQQAEATEAQQADAEQSETEAAQSQADGEQTADAEQTDAGGQHLRCNISGRTVPAGRKRIRCKYCGKRSEVQLYSGGTGSNQRC